MVFYKSNPKEPIRSIPVINTCNNYLVFIVNEDWFVNWSWGYTTYMNFIVLVKYPNTTNHLNLYSRSWYRTLLRSINKTGSKVVIYPRWTLLIGLIVDSMMTLTPPLSEINNSIELKFNFIYLTEIISLIKLLNKTLVIETRSCQLHWFD